MPRNKKKGIFMIEATGKYTSAKIMIDDIESSCLAQIYGMLSHPAFTNPIAIMPDTHAGKGSVIGFTMEMTDKIISSIVGVDIGCGMLAGKFDEDVYTSIDQPTLDGLIRNRIPFGHGVHSESLPRRKDVFKKFPWDRAQKTAIQFARKYGEKFGIRISPPTYNEHWFEEKCLEVGVAPRYAISSIGTLGGGNHFIEIGKSESKNEWWITIHSGSRNFGLKICMYWHKMAVQTLRQRHQNQLRERIEWIKKHFESTHFETEIENAKKELGLLDTPVSSDLSPLDSKNATDYLFDMVFAQTYASYNRKIMLDTIKNIIGMEPTQTIETVHNYVDFNDLIIRKGAVASYKNELILLPFNMRDGMLICEGKSNEEWNFSAPHGAGRLLSRSQAKKTLSLDNFKQTMENANIYSTSIGYSTLDEAPNAYKDPAIITELIKPTATIVDRIKVLQNLKDKGKKK